MKKVFPVTPALLLSENLLVPAELTKLLGLSQLILVKSGGSQGGGFAEDCTAHHFSIEV